jgi:hypothetical protein
VQPVVITILAASVFHSAGDQCFMHDCANVLRISARPVQWILTSLLFGICLATPAAFGSEASLREIVESIRKNRPEYDAAILRNQLDGLPIDKDALPARDEKSGAFNILGETPRDKLLTDFIKQVVDYTKDVTEATAIQNRGIQLLSDSQGTWRQVAIDFVTRESGAERQPWQPLKLSMSIGDQTPVELSYLPAAADLSDRLSIAATVLPVGRHRIRMRGVAVALTNDGVERIGALRDARHFDQTLEVDVTNSGPSDSVQQQLYAIRSGPQGLVLEPKSIDVQKD